MQHYSSSITLHLIQKKLIKINPFNVVIFGGTGDLALRKIYPALFHRYADNQIKCDFNIFSIARKEKNNSNFHKIKIDYN